MSQEIFQFMDTGPPAVTVKVMRRGFTLEITS